MRRLAAWRSDPRPEPSPPRPSSQPSCCPASWSSSAAMLSWPSPARPCSSPLVTGQVSVQRAVWNGHVTVPKGGRVRHVPLTTRLATTLRTHRHLRGVRVLTTKERALTQRMVQHVILRMARRAHVPQGVHILRHTFCSHLAMRGAPARAIQELAGHRDLSTTQRYMHLSPAAKGAAIRLLDEPPPFSCQFNRSMQQSPRVYPPASDSRVSCGVAC